MGDVGKQKTRMTQGFKHTTINENNQHESMIQ